MAEMGKLISGTLADILKKNRTRYNTLFALARQTRPSLDGEMLGYYLLEVVQPVILELEQRHSGNIEPVTDALFENILNLMKTHRLGAGSRNPEFETCWKNAMTQLAEIFELNPNAIVNKITNALVTIFSVPDTRPLEWMARMVKIKPLIRDEEIFKKAGFVSAWMSGMAHYRDTALEILNALPDEMVSAMFPAIKNSGGTIREFVTELKNNPWKNPDAIVSAPEVLKQVRAIGAFTGFGGLFPTPPTVTADSKGIIVRCRDRSWRLHADRYGHYLQPINASSLERRSPACPFEYYKNGTVFKGDRHTFIPELKDAASYAGNEHTFAVTSRCSHRVYVLAVVTP